MCRFDDTRRRVLHTAAGSLLCAWNGVFVGTVHASETVLTFSKIDGTGRVDEIAIATLTEAYKRLGISIRFKEFPTMRALAASSSGLTDGEMQRRGGLSEQYPQLIQIDVPINVVNFCVFTRTAEFVPDGWDSLRPYRIGFHRGILAIEEGTRGMNIDPADSNEQLLLKLMAGRTDIVVMTETDGQELLSATSDTKIHKLSPPIASIKLYHYLNRSHKAIAVKIQAVLKSMADSGVLASIRERVMKQPVASVRK